MATFNYTAVRGLVKTSLLAVGSDISAALGDLSFNATTTNLSGAADNSWLDVSGFTNAANNGVMQVNGNSTTTKIIQDTNTLVTEAAGNVVTIQGYVRGVGESYTLETAAHNIVPADRPVVKRAQSLDGTSENIFTRNDEMWNITTDFIDADDFPQWREFLKSIHAGEPFTFDPYGTIATPVDPVSVEIMGTPSYANPFKLTMQITMRVRVL